MKKSINISRGLLISFSTLALLLPPQSVLAHCDTLDGPVVADARIALARGNVFPVLKWIHAESEAEIRASFEHVLTVRGLNPAARELADRYFFETLVRVHRAGEGAAFTGLKAVGTVEPVVAKADHALEHDSVGELINGINKHVQEGIHERFVHASETKKHAQESVQAGREFVEAYVNYVHYVEGIADMVHGGGHHPETDSSNKHLH